MLGLKKYISRCHSSHSQQFLATSEAKNNYWNTKFSMVYILSFVWLCSGWCSNKTGAVVKFMPTGVHATRSDISVQFLF